MKKIFFAIVITILLALLFPIQGRCQTKRETVLEEWDALFYDLETIDDEYLEEWFLSYIELSETYPEYIHRDTIHNFYSNEEINLLLRVVETEAHGADFVQKVNVANVLLNRYWEYDTFGYTSMIDVVVEPNQFTYGRTIITDDTINALNFAFEIMDTTNGAIGFKSDKYSKTWNGWQYEFYDGGHYFYKLKE